MTSPWITGIAAVAALATSSWAIADVSQLGLQLESSRRVARTTYDYAYRVQATNSGIIDVIATAVFTSNSPHTVIVDGAVDFGRLTALGSGWSIDTITIRHDRLYPFDSGALRMQPTARPALTVHLETTNSASAVIDPTGGQVTAAGSSGHSFSLSIPEFATSTATITVTPVTAVQGFALSDSIIAAVQFSPEGLTFARPATLTISPPAGVAFSPSVIAFQIADGRADALAPQLRNGTLEIAVTHFSEIILTDFQSYIDAAPIRAQTFVQERFDEFMAWTLAFIGRDFDYFQTPGSHVYPNCAISESVANEAFGLCRLQDLLPGPQPAICDPVLVRLSDVFGSMIDGFGSANTVCGNSGGDDTLLLQCAATLDRLFNVSSNFEDIYGGDAFKGKHCGAVSVVGTPSPISLLVGETTSILFSVLDPTRTVLPRSIWFDYVGNAAVATISPVNDNTVAVTCNSVGAVTVQGRDRQALAAGILGNYLTASVPVLCVSPVDTLAMVPSHGVVIGGESTTFRVGFVGEWGQFVPVSPGLTFHWSIYNPMGVSYDFQLNVDPQNSGQATLARPLDRFWPWTGFVYVSACLYNESNWDCDPTVGAIFEVVPDIRGSWYGTGYQVASGCQDSDDNGVNPFYDWVIQFTQQLVPGTTNSSISGVVSGSGIGAAIQGPLVGVMTELGWILGNASYSSEDGGSGEATFDGGVGLLRIDLDFEFRDVRGDTCSGYGSVALTP